MNDLGMIAGLDLGSRANSSASAGEKRTSSIELGRTSSPEAAKGIAEQEVKAEIKESSVEQAVVELNSYIQNERRDLFFSLEGSPGEMVVRVVDRESGELIRQMPNQVVLDLAANVRQNEPLQLIDMQG